MPSSINFCSADFNGYATLPEGLIVSGANSVLVGVPPWPHTATLQTRLNGSTPLTESGNFVERTLFDGSRSAFFYSCGFYWTGPPDAAVCANEILEFRVHWVYSDGSTEDTPWTRANPFVPGGAAIRGVGGGGADQLAEILRAVKKTY